MQLHAEQHILSGPYIIYNYDPGQIEEVSSSLPEAVYGTSIESATEIYSPILCMSAKTALNTVLVVHETRKYDGDCNG